MPNHFRLNPKQHCDKNPLLLSLFYTPTQTHLKQLSVQLTAPRGGLNVHMRGWAGRKRLRDDGKKIGQKDSVAANELHCILCVNQANFLQGQFAACWCWSDTVIRQTVQCNCSSGDKKPKAQRAKSCRYKSYLNPVTLYWHWIELRSRHLIQQGNEWRTGLTGNVLGCLIKRQSLHLESIIDVSLVVFTTSYLRLDAEFAISTRSKSTWVDKEAWRCCCCCS